MMTSSAEVEAAASSISHDEVLLVEDDDGDALLVEELLLEVDAPVVVRRARSLNQAKGLLAGAACVLLDLGLPDSQGLNGFRQ
jgi:response regulator of citrate/malate metabolism